MNKTISGALSILILVVVVSVGIKLLKPKFDEYHQKTTSDAIHTKGKIRIAMDNWVGYFPLRSPEMDSLMRKSGYLLIVEDDKADYSSRMNKLENGEIDFAVATVDSYILNARKYDYPGIIVMVIDESKGGDAILTRKNRINSLDQLKGNSGIKVAFTPDSPSHHLLKAAADHFNVPELLPPENLRIETDGSEKAREKLLSKEADIAVCWEPDVSRLLSDNAIIKLLGTEDTQRLIVDILVVNRKFAQREPEVVSILLNNYFKALNGYKNDSDLLLKHVKSETGLQKTAVESMLKGVEWVNLTENAEKWYGISKSGLYADEGLIDTINSTIKILISAQDFTKNPIPDQDPYRLINSSFIEKLYEKGVFGFTAPKTGTNGQLPSNSIEARFPSLTNSEWDKLKEVGTLKVDPIVFQAGAIELDTIAKTVVDQAVERLKHYPNFRIVIKGHTSIKGDKQENFNLSQERADSVSRYLEVVYNIDPNRMRSIGYGGSKPLPMKAGESKRSWTYRLPRVELVLVREDY